MSRKMERESVLERLYKTGDPELIRIGKAWVNKKMKPRSGADRAGAVPMAQKLLMKRMHEKGLSFRALEAVFHLGRKEVGDNEGNMAQRCVNAAEDYAKAKGGKTKGKALATA